MGLTTSFVLGSLVAWIFGHLVGAEQYRQHIEIQFKLIAWMYASLVAGDVILKYALDIPDLTGYWSALCIFISVSSGLGLFYYLRAGIHWRDRNKLYALSFFLAAALILYAIYAKVVVF